MGKILLADDSNVAQRMGKEILSAQGFEVMTVSNGQAALKALKDMVPDLILADIFMPVKSGYEVCQFVKTDKRLRDVPVVLLVGAMEPYDPDEGAKVKADGVITKPLQASNLVKVVQDLVAAAKARKPAPPPVVEPEAWQTEEQAAEVFHYQEKQVEIPKDLGEQPVAAFSDLLGTDAEPEAAKLISEVPATETSQATLLATEAVSPSVSKAAPAFPEQTIQEFPASVESLPETHEMEPASTNPLLTVEAAVEQSPEAASSQPGADFWARFGGGQEPEADRAQQPAAEESTSPKPHEAGANLPGSELWAPLGGPQEIESAEDRHPPTAEIPQAEAPLAASTNLPGTDFLANFGAVEEIETVAIELPPAEEPPSPEPQAAQKIFWVVETAEVTAEDRKLFDQSQSDWEGLTKMVEEQSTESSGGPSTNLSDRTISPGAREDEVPTEPLPSPHVQVEASGAASPGSIAVSGMPSPEAANDTEIAGAEVPEGEPPEANVAPGPQLSSEKPQETGARLHGIDDARMEHLIRQTVQDMMPQIVDRIVRAVEIILRREQD